MVEAGEEDTLTQRGPWHLWAGPPAQHWVGVSSLSSMALPHLLLCPLTWTIQAIGHLPCQNDFAQTFWEGFGKGATPLPSLPSEEVPRSAKPSEAEA